MEALGAAASVAGLVQLAGKVTSLGYDYIGKVRRASDDIRQLVGEVSSLSNVLKTLKEITDEFKPDATLGALQRVRFEALQTLDEPLKEFTLELTSFESDLRRKMEKKGWERRFRSIKWPFKEAENKEIMVRIERLKGLIQIALDADHITLSKAIDEGVQHLKSGAAIENAAQNSWRRNEELDRIKEKRKKVLYWLYPENHDTKHTEISAKRQKDTGKWFLESPEFQELVDEKPNSSSGLLWGYGIPGAGKTFLSSLVIDYLRERTKSKNLNHGVAYVYFDYKQQERQKPDHVLANLLKQLASNLKKLPVDLEGLYDDLEHKGERPTFQALYPCFLSTLTSFNRTFLVFDALDECDQENQRKELLPLFHRMKAVGASVFMTSRQYPEDIQESFNAVSKIKLAAKEEDIRSYIEERIEGNPRARRLIQQGQCKERIISQMIDCANGMFLLVRFHINYICEQTTANEVIAALNKLQRSSQGDQTLAYIYDQTMTTIKNKPKNHVDLAIQILSWLVKAKQILTVDEILKALSIKQGNYESDDNDLLDRTTLLDVCGGLVTIDENSNTIRLAHFTIYEYILRNNILPQDVDLKLAMGCLTYLSFDIFTYDPQPDDGEHEDLLDKLDRLDDMVFLGYATRYMIQHLKYCDEALSKDLILEFLERPKNFCFWYLASRFIENSYLSPSLLAKYTRLQPKLHMASSIGNSLVVQQLLDGGCDVSERHIHDDSTAIGWAAVEGHEAIIRLLVKNGASIQETYDNDDDNGPRTILEIIVHKGYLSLVRLFLEMGVSTKMQNKHGRSLLVTAAYEGHVEVVRLLLEKGADVNGEDIYVGDTDGDKPTAIFMRGVIERDTPLIAAAQGGHMEVAELLLEEGADVQRQGKHKSTSLFAAAQGGHERVAKMLLEKGAEVNEGCMYGYAPLVAAARGGHEAVVKLLLEKGAYIRGDEYRHQSPLIAAVYGGNEAVVKMLLEKDTYAESLCKGDTPLLIAVREGREAIVEILLEKGADTEEKNENSETPLLIAARKGHEAVVRMLLKEGANTEVNSTFEDLSHCAVSSKYDEDHRENVGRGGETPLTAAVQRGYEAVVEILLANGANIERKSGGATPLTIAAHEGNEALVRFLLKMGANIHGAPLCAAAKHGHKTVVEMLLRKGACIEELDICDRTPLHCAAEGGHVAIVEMMLGMGASTEKQDIIGETPLFSAAKVGSEKTVRLLFEKGVAIDIPDKYGNTPLMATAMGSINLDPQPRQRYKAVAEFLLEKGAAIEARNEYGNTPLLAAALWGQDEIVNLLLEKGATIEARNENGDTPLVAAVMGSRWGLYKSSLHKRKAVVELLLEKGAAIEARNKDGSTALRCAEISGDEGIVKLLREKVLLSKCR